MLLKVKNVWNIYNIIIDDNISCLFIALFSPVTKAALLGGLTKYCTKFIPGDA